MRYRRPTVRTIGVGFVTTLVAGMFAIAGGAATAAPLTTAADAEDSSAFPVTIVHAFGETTIAEQPQRIVSIGFTDHDALLALGVAPVGIRHWYGDDEFVWPWAQAALGDLTPVVLSADELSFEAIAALEPDLIIGQFVGLEQDEYDSLTAIAPTVAQPGEYPSFGAPWQLMTRNIGRAVGRSEQAEALVADVEGRYAAIRAAHPEFEGRELAYAGAYGTDAPIFYVETNGSTRMRVLQDLGFVVPADLDALGTDSFYHDISGEQLDLLDQEVVLWEPAEFGLLDAIRSNALYQTLAVHTEGRDVFIDDPLIAAALAHSTVLSLPVVLDWLEPQLARAVANLDS